MRAQVVATNSSTGGGRSLLNQRRSHESQQHLKLHVTFGITGPVDQRIDKPQQKKLDGCEVVIERRAPDAGLFRQVLDGNLVHGLVSRLLGEGFNDRAEGPRDPAIGMLDM